MKFIGKKLASKRGETLVEILVAILIIALSAGLFAAMYTASMNINLSAQKQDKMFYEAVETLEKMIESTNKGAEGTVTYTEGTLTYTSVDSEGKPNTTTPVDVQFFTQDGMTAYGVGTTATTDSEEGGE